MVKEKNYRKNNRNDDDDDNRRQKKKHIPTFGVTMEIALCKENSVGAEEGVFAGTVEVTLLRYREGRGGEGRRPGDVCHHRRTVCKIVASAT